MAGGVPLGGAAVPGQVGEGIVKTWVCSMAGESGCGRDGCGAHAVGRVEQREAQEEGWWHKWLETVEKLSKLA